MRNDFLTVPEFPDYEINSNLEVRRKSDGKILKVEYRTDGGVRVVLRVDGKSFYRSARIMRLKAVDAAKTCKRSRWLPVPSTGGRYEMYPNGDLRNARTLRFVIKQFRGNQVYYQIWNRDKGMKVMVSLKSLLWEVYGIEPEKILYRVPVTLTKDGKVYELESMTAAAKYVAPKVNRSVSRVNQLLRAGQEEIFGYKVRYHSRVYRLGGESA